jgi:hypothetical protein
MHAPPLTTLLEIWHYLTTQWLNKPKDSSNWHHCPRQSSKLFRLNNEILVYWSRPLQIAQLGLLSHFSRRIGRVMSLHLGHRSEISVLHFDLWVFRRTRLLNRWNCLFPLCSGRSRHTFALVHLLHGISRASSLHSRGRNAKAWHCNFGQSCQTFLLHRTEHCVHRC